ncbi:RelA/SpoT domain-containing protein [Gallaecimonas mangrovi]|uniref:RelA/SpoT domain-containing protein n=1 Tax=Gallaecimonas mangrovi TaxID=2291597 RepID=UPI000E204CFB|nr:RelA/SpoT domain-containing protein [Gallaecimonas mangrovi]
MNISPAAIEKNLVEEISSKLDSVGLMYRIFSRLKSEQSLNNKIESNDEYGNSKKIQDLIGIRVVLYFSDDIETVRKIVSSKFDEKSNDVSIDEVKKEEFRAIRYNIVYSLPSNDFSSFEFNSSTDFIDSTFELQIRTIFSEGWHEIEHDLRYKCKNDWNGYDGESRLLNGVYASLENSEWTMIKIFDELAYSHYKSRQWSAMIRQKFRLRFVDESLDDDICNILSNDVELAKKFFRVERSFLISEMNRLGFYFPMKINNVFYFMNIISVKDQMIFKKTPALMMEEMNG